MLNTKNRLAVRYTNILDGYSVVNANLEPLYEAAATFNFPAKSGSHAEVRFSMQDEHLERPYVEISPLREPTEKEILDTIEILYAIIANGELPDSRNAIGEARADNATSPKPPTQ